MTLKVLVTYKGQTYENGVGLPYFFVLPQADGRIIFHLGVLGDVPKDQDPKQPFVMDAYSVVIEKDGADIFDANIPSHFWNARWTYYPIVTGPVANRMPADIVASRRMFPYGDVPGCKVDAPPNTPPYFYMGSSSITIYMPQTGERPDIGLITDNSAYYMLGKSSSGMIAWGLSGNSCPMHFRDQNTGKPIDLIKYYSTNAYSLPGYQGGPWVAQGKQAANGYCEYGGGWTPQQAHYCEMSYLAYQATKDTSFLEDLQYSANFTVFCDAYLSGGRKKPTVFGEYRGIAWAFRNLFMAHVATLDAEASGTLPDSCMTSDYWKALLDIQLEYYAPNMIKPDNQVFRLVSGPGKFGPWQVDYMLTVLAFGVLTGHADWAPLYVWALGNAIARTNNTSWQQGGYPPGWGGAYYMDIAPSWYDSFVAMKDGPDGGPTQAQIDALKVDPLNGGKAMVGQEYLMTTRAVLIMADYLDKQGICNVRGTYPELDKCIQICETMNRSYGSMNPRVSVISTGGHMPASITINVGQSVPVIATYTPDGSKPDSASYTQTDSNVGALSNETVDGALFTAANAGQTIIGIHAQGSAGDITDIAEVTVKHPLPDAVSLSFGPVS